MMDSRADKNPYRHDRRADSLSRAGHILSNVTKQESYL